MYVVILSFDHRDPLLLDTILCIVSKRSKADMLADR